MRKTTLTAAVLTAVLLGGCGAPPPGGASELQGAASASRLPSSAAETVRFELDSDRRSDSVSADDGTLLASYTYTIPVLRAVTESGTVLETAATQAQQRALDAADAFNAELASWVENMNFPEIFDWARSDYQMLDGDVEWTGYYSEEFTYTFWRTERLISVTGDYYSYTGGAHPNSTLVSWNFDLETGRFLHVTALGEDTEGFQAAVTEELIRQADRRAMDEDCAPTEMYWENYRDILSRWPDYAVTFSNSGMTVSYPAYELAAYALGPQVFELDMDFLEPYLSADGRELLGLPPV